MRICRFASSERFILENSRTPAVPAGEFREEENDPPRTTPLWPTGEGRFYRFHQLADAGIPWSRKHVNFLEAQGRFPKRVWLGENTCAWPCDEIDDYVDERIRTRARAVRKAGPVSKSQPMAS